MDPKIGVVEAPEAMGRVRSARRAKEELMTGKKTHEQQLRVIEKREKTANAGEDFDAKADLQRNAQAREAHRKGDDLKPNPDTGNDDRAIVRGRNQESEHKKGSGRP